MPTETVSALAPNTTINPPTASETTTGKTNTNAALSSDFETFLRMLTVQLQNQDPLNPVEASDYAVQLATFSGVEQQVQTNDHLQNLASQMQLMGLSQFAGWVGMQARHAGGAHFGGQPIEMETKVGSGADDAYLIVRDQFDNQVQRIKMTPESGPITWNGVNSNGNEMTHGTYHFYVESLTNGASTGIQKAEVYSTITEAKSENGQTILGLVGGNEIQPDEVTSIRTLG